jgi:hypothetical protein
MGNPAHMPGLTARRAIVKDEPLPANCDSASDLSYANMCDLGSLSGMRHVARASPGPGEGAHPTCCSLACAHRSADQGGAHGAAPFRPQRRHVDGMDAYGIYANGTELSRRANHCLGRFHDMDSQSL